MKRGHALKISLIYLLLGTGWIIISDLVSSALALPETFQTSKGLLFIVVTAVVLYWLTSAYDAGVRRDQTFQRAMVDASPIAVYTMDLDGNVLSWNKAAETTFGWHADEAIGKPLPIVPEDKQDEFTEIRNRIIGGDTVSGLELRRRRKDGSEFDGMLYMAPIHDEADNIVGILAMMNDITEQKSLQNQLQHSQKMEAVGRLAGGVAHDFNNLLSVISGYSEMVLEELPESDSNREAISEIRDAGQRAARLTRQLLAFSRKQNLSFEILDINEVIRNMTNMVRRLIGEDIDLVMDLSDDLYRVKFDPGQVEQIIMNLVVNARDAMPEGGKFTIETANVELSEDYANTRPDARAGPHAMIAVTDTGHGMDADTQSHIFDPFFTTKLPEQGTGLGLSTVFGIVKQSGGSIWVYSEPNQGTRFKIYLPRSEGAVSDRDHAEITADAPEATETILLVEDEDEVRQLARRGLELEGYTVFDTSNVDEAIEICKWHEGDLDILLTDVVLPRLSGPQLAEKAVALRPNLKIIFMSGYTAQSIVDQGILEHDVAFIEKPITPQTLVRKIRDVLENSRKTDTDA